MADLQGNDISIVTQLGKSLVARAIAGGKTLNLSQLALGSGTDLPKESQTALQDEKARVSLLSVEQSAVTPSLVSCTAAIPSDVGGFIAHEAGLYTAQGELIAVAQFNPAISKPVASDQSAREVLIKFDILLAGLEQIDLKIDPHTVVASRLYVNDQALRTAIKNAAFSEEVQHKDVVYFDAKDQVFKPAIADGSEKQKVIGFADTIEKRVYTEWFPDTFYTTFKVGGIYYLHNGRAGKMRSTPPDTYAIRLGRVVSNKLMIISIEDETVRHALEITENKVIFPKRSVEVVEFSAKEKIVSPFVQSAKVESDLIKAKRIELDGFVVQNEAVERLSSPINISIITPSSQTAKSFVYTSKFPQRASSLSIFGTVRLSVYGQKNFDVKPRGQVAFYIGNRMVTDLASLRAQFAYAAAESAIHTALPTFGVCVKQANDRTVRLDLKGHVIGPKDSRLSIYSASLIIIERTI